MLLLNIRNQEKRIKFQVILLRMEMQEKHLQLKGINGEFILHQMKLVIGHIQLRLEKENLQL